MNYLAHAYLSFGEPKILVGNMISDFVKGKKKFSYENDILRGINLHRATDNFTDKNAFVKQAAKPFKPFVGLYSGAFVDIVFDHFLALDENELSKIELLDFSERTYQTLFTFESILPEKFAQMLQYMSSQNWLFNYRNKEGIKNSFEGLKRRAKYLHNTNEAYEIFEKQYNFLQTCYANFFPLLKDFAFQQINLSSN